MNPALVPPLHQRRGLAADRHCTRSYTCAPTDARSAPQTALPTSVHCGSAGLGSGPAAVCASRSGRRQFSSGRTLAFFLLLGRTDKATSDTVFVLLYPNACASFKAPSRQGNWPMPTKSWHSSDAASRRIAIHTAAPAASDCGT